MGKSSSFRARGKSSTTEHGARNAGSATSEAPLKKKTGVFPKKIRRTLAEEIPENPDIAAVERQGAPLS
jgi:hypothetical protein